MRISIPAFWRRRDIADREPTPVVALPQATTDEEVELPRPTERDWLGVVRSARTRILAAYIVLLAVSAAIAILAIRQVLLIQLEDRVQNAGQQEVLELDRLVAEGRDPTTGQLFTSPEALFDVYLARNVPSNEEALLTFVDGRFHRSALARYPLDRLPSDKLAEWATISSNAPAEGERVTGSFETRLGDAYFRARRVVIGDASGALIVAILPAEEREDIGEVVRYGAIATGALLVLASVAAWLIAGTVLKPVQQLTETASFISQSDLTRRVKVRGGGEPAEMARSFNAMLDRLEGVFRAHREFVQDASHELRDPLTICRGHLELLGDDADERKRTVALVLDELDRMGRIVDDLQLLSDADQPDFLRPEWIDLRIFTHELTSKAGALSERRWSHDRIGDGPFLADRHRLTEAMMNLAHNALQHTTEEDTLAIGTSLADEEVHLWLRDTGAGISVADQATIFERFTRGTGAQRRYRGSGLGLAIVKAIAEAHGGRIDLESRLGEGSTFTIVLPRQVSAPHIIEGIDVGPDPDR
jgi:two-component system, OmpR family, sensor kinase